MASKSKIIFRIYKCVQLKEYTKEKLEKIIDETIKRAANILAAN
jgi:hypothetical protein